VKSFKEKIEMIKEFTKEFDRNVIDINERNLLGKISLEEFLDPMFENEFINILYSYHYSHSKTNVDKFLLLVQDNRIDNFMEKLNKEQREKVYDKIIDKMKETDISIRGNFLNLKNDEYSEFLLKIIDNNLLNRFYNNYEDFIKLAANYAMSYKDLITINKIKTAFDKDPEFSKLYVDYPLVIINKNLKKEDKIEIIKSTYRKKDLNKYTKFIRNNLRDMNDLDDFIEATILQNNRVHKERSNFIDLIRRIFIGMRGEYFYGEINLDKLENVEEFTNKYRDYFTTEVVKDLTQISNWHIQNNVINFISKLFKNQNFEYKMIVSRGNQAIGQRLFSNLDEIPEEIIGNEKLERLYLNYMINTSSKITDMLNSDFHLTMSYVNKYPEIFSEAFREAYKIGSNGNYYTYYSIMSDTNTIINFLSNLKEDNIVKFELFTEEYFIKLGMVSNLSEWNSHNSISTDANKFFNVIIPILEETCENNPIFKQYLYKKYFNQFENEDYMNDMVTNISKILNTDRIGSAVVSEFNENSLQDVIIKLFTKLKDFAKILPDSDLIVENIEKARDELIIICTL
jgi:hypothetical protein